jgi:hypothetical protein
VSSHTKWRRIFDYFRDKWSQRPMDGSQPFEIFLRNIGDIEN